MDNTRSESIRCYIINRNGGKTTGYLDFSVTSSETMNRLSEVLGSLKDFLGPEYSIVTGRSPINDSIEDKLDKITELLKRSKNE